MANRIEQARAAVDACIREAYLRAAAAGDLPEGADVRGSVEQPKDTANGDFAANHAMASAKTMHMAPRKIAEAIVHGRALKIEGGPVFERARRRCGKCSAEWVGPPECPR